MAIPNPTDLERYNLFNGLRNEGAVPITLQALTAIWRTRNYTQPAQPVIAARPPIGRAFTGVRSADYAAAPQPLAADEQAWLANDVGLPNGLLAWRGVKMLGSGTYGKVGLWQYQPNNALARPFHDRVAVKEALDASQDLEDEVDHLIALKRLVAPVESKHIANMIHPPHVITNQNKGVLDQAWVGKTMRIYLEYCPLGSLESAMRHRRQTHIPYKEITLWHIFNCLADGGSMMQYGREAQIVRGQAIAPDPAVRFDPIVHMDLKVDNILLSGQDEAHSVAPVMKMADFGFSMTVADALTNKKIMREWGTRPFFLPEQFTERWDYQDWNTSPIAGAFSDKSNIWAIGLVMYRLITFESNDIINNPFFPNFPLNGGPAQGITYGYNLTTYFPEYSGELTSLIFECLYENPQHRPTLLELKTRTAQGIIDIAARGPPHSLAEDWTNFVKQPPRANAPARVPAVRCTWLHVGGTTKVNGVHTGNGQGKQCLREVIPTILNSVNGVIRCPKHNDRRIYP